MKSSKSSKTEVDDISRETQRLVSDSHVHLPYHIPKQKSLKDFLNRQKISKECQVSITGSKKLLQKAWELIESKEKNVEKFYNEDCIHDENNEELCSSNDNIQAEKITFVNNDDVSHCDKELILDKKIKNKPEYSEDEEYDEKNSITDSELSSNDDDDEINFKQNLDDENLENHLNSNDFEKDNTCSNNGDELNKNMAKSFIDDEAELSESDYSSENEENIPNFIDESDDEDEFSKKKKRKLTVLSESEDENDNIDDENSNIESQLTNDLYKMDTNVCTQQLLGLCSGQFQTQQSEAKENEEDFEDEFDSDVPQNDDNNTQNDDSNTQHDESNTQNDDSNTQNDYYEMPKPTSIKDIFKDEEDDFDNSENDVNFEELPKITSIKDVFRDETDDSNDSDNNEDIKPKPTSAKDFFDDEAELSESDWSSDDEDHLIETIDKLEEEEGDKDKLDEDIVKDGLDKIYMRQLLDDDQKQVTALKEMLLEDGDLHSDSGRKRKFQWEESDQNDVAFKKPLFSEDEDEDEDEVMSEDEKLGNWRNERFKRESFLSQQDEEEYDQNEENSSAILKSSVSFVKKTHIVKFQKNDGKKISNNENNESMQLNSEINSNNEKNTSVLITDTSEINTSNLPDFQVTNIASKPNKFVKGSFMKHNNNKMTNTLLYVNKNPIFDICDEKKKNGKYEDKSEIKSMNTITAKASSNPFAYLLRNDNKEDITRGVMNVEKKANDSYLGKPGQSTSVHPIHQVNQTKILKSMNSILKQLE